MQVASSINSAPRNLSKSETRAEAKAEETAARAGALQARMNDVDCVAIVSGGNPHIWDTEGKALTATGEEATTGKSLQEKLKNFIMPSEMENVHEDYTTYRKWHGVSNASAHTLSFLGTQGVVQGLAGALSSGIPFLGGVAASLGLAALTTYALKDGLNWVGTLIGGNMAKKVDEDPAKWLKIASNVDAAASAAQSVLIAVPGAFLALAPLSSLTSAWAGNMKGSAEVKIQNHQAKQGIAEMTGKNKNQDLITSAAGFGLGALASVVGHALLVPILGPFAPLAVVPAAILVNQFANRKAAKALQFDNLTQTNVSKIAHQSLQDDTILAPKEMQDKEHRLPKRQADVVVGGDGTSVFSKPEHREQVLNVYGHTPYLVDYDGKKVQVTLRTDATEKDVVKAAWQAQLMADVVGSEGFKTLKSQVGEEAAALQASALTLGAVSDLEPQMKALGEKGWDLEHNQIRTPNVRVDWKESETPLAVPHLGTRDLRKFMETGELPADLKLAIAA